MGLWVGEAMNNQMRLWFKKPICSQVSDTIEQSLDDASFDYLKTVISISETLWKRVESKLKKIPVVVDY